MDHGDLTDVLRRLKDAQQADHDNREKAREAHAFVDKRDGQWEPGLWSANEGKPRYTFDQVNPIIDQIAGEMELAEFSVQVNPAGGDATKEIASTYDGLVRNIETISNAQDIYDQAGRSMITAGTDGWQVTQRYIDGDSFDQDLVIEAVGNWIDRVWFGPGEERDRSDCEYAWVLTGVDKNVFKQRYPDASPAAVGSDRFEQLYYYKPELVVIGEYRYIKETERELVLMSNGAVYEDDGDFKKVADELSEQGITERMRRSRPKQVLMSRKFTASEWLEEAKETVFDSINLVPCYANFKITEDKTIYWGVVEKLLDPQRVMNYSMSREIEEGALAPRAKYWMTNEQVSGHTDTLNTLNTNSDPVQTYNHDPRVPGPPQQSGGAQINQGLRAISEGMRGIIGMTAGKFAATMGDNPGLQSGVAIDNLQYRGDVGNVKYFRAREVAMARTGRLLIKAIPKVYGPERQVRLVAEDGTSEMAVLNEPVFDDETETTVVLNDLSTGVYDVNASSGPSFESRQSETVSAMVELGGVDPSVIELGGDILLNSVNAPGMSQIAERKREQLIKANAIPEDQLTDEEREEIQKAKNQPKEPDAAMVLAQAEMKKADADILKAQNDQQQLQLQAQGKGADIQIAQMQTQQKAITEQRKADNEQFKTMLAAQDQAHEQAMKENAQQLAEMQLVVDALAKSADIEVVIEKQRAIDTSQPQGERTNGR